MLRAGREWSLGKLRHICGVEEYVRLKLIRVQFLEARTSLKWQLSLLIAEEVEAVPESDLSGASEQEWVFTKRRRAVRRGGL